MESDLLSAGSSGGPLYLGDGTTKRPIMAVVPNDLGKLIGQSLKTYGEATNKVYWARENELWAGSPYIGCAGCRVNGLILEIAKEASQYPPPVGTGTLAQANAP